MFSLYSNYEDHGASDADSCDFYGTVDETHGCHIDKFPTETMEDLFGDNVSKCCTFHGYTMHDNCDVGQFYEILFLIVQIDCKFSKYQHSMTHPKKFPI